MAYAAVISLKRTIERFINPTNLQITKSAYEELKFLEYLLKKLDNNSNNSNKSAIDALDAEIRKAVWKLEDVLDSYVLYHSLPPSLDEKGLEQAIDSFLKTVKKLGEEYNRELDNPLPEEEEVDAAVSHIDDFGGKKSTTVGLSDQIEKISKELLDWQSPGLKTVSLVGMAGIGKTHLAREIYQHLTIVQDFDFTAWVTVGQKYEMKNTLVDIVAQIECKPRNLYMEENTSTLIVLLQKRLHGRRYLIVWDDIWSTKVCSDMIWLLPANGNGRRLLLTTRLGKVAKYHSTKLHRMPFLSNEDSWILLGQNVFGGKCFPPQLEKAGRMIAKNCEGLPLLILAVANILCRLEKTEEYWEKVADKKTTTFTDAYDIISKVLSSSYEHLPLYLKVCFLYMGVFPQNSVIPMRKLITLWTIEDFVQSIFHQSKVEEIASLHYFDVEAIASLHQSNLEDFAMTCLEDIVSDSLAIICKHSSNNRIKSSKLHSAYWHLCVKEARKNKFFHVLTKLTDGLKDYMESQRRLSVQNNILFSIKEVYDSIAATITARSLLCTGEDHQYPVPICFNLMFLKVLDALAIRFYEFPNEVLKLVQLRYLALTYNGELPSSISKLQQLQCLIVRQHHNFKLPKKIWDMRGLRSTTLLRDSCLLPKEIWYLQELKHLRIMGSNLPDPSYDARLPSLLTLHVNAHSCTEAVFLSIPNLKKLGIKIELQPDAAETVSCFQHISLLCRLESLKCVIVNPRLRSNVAAPPDHLSNLPWRLKKLSLDGLGYSWKYMSVIGSLQFLEVLKLRCCAFHGAEWETKVEEFPSLKFLLLEDIDVVHWTARGNCFPRLRRLIIRHCYKLKEIPRQIGAFPTLETMEVVDCSPSVVASAQQIHDDRNNFLEAVISSSWNFRR